MRDPYQRMIKYAYELVEDITKEYKDNKKVAFFPLLAGIGSCVVECRHNGHNPHVVVKEINQYFDDTKDVDVINGFEDGILTMIKMSKNIPCFADTFVILHYQFELEKKGEAKFEINRKKIAEALNKHMEENFEELKKIDKFEEWYLDEKEYFKTEFGFELN